MSKTDYADEVSKFKGSKKKGRPVDKVQKCMYTGCPVNAATSVNGLYKCTFHFAAGDYPNDIITAIKKNSSFINRYNAMVKWKVSDWAKQQPSLIKSKNCPMIKDEFPSMYVNRFFNWLSDKIANEASAIVEQRKLNYPGGFEDEF